MSKHNKNNLQNSVQQESVEDTSVNEEIFVDYEDGSPAQPLEDTPVIETEPVVETTEEPKPVEEPKTEPTPVAEPKVESKPLPPTDDGRLEGHIAQFARVSIDENCKTDVTGKPIPEYCKKRVYTVLKVIPTDDKNYRLILGYKNYKVGVRESDVRTPLK